MLGNGLCVLSGRELARGAPSQYQLDAPVSASDAQQTLIDLEITMSAKRQQRILLKSLDTSVSYMSVGIAKVCVAITTAAHALNKNLKNINVSISCILFFSVIIVISS